MSCHYFFPDEGLRRTSVHHQGTRAAVHCARHSNRQRSSIAAALYTDGARGRLGWTAGRPPSLVAFPPTIMTSFSCQQAARRCPCRPQFSQQTLVGERACTSSSERVFRSPRHSLRRWPRWPHLQQDPLNSPELVCLLLPCCTCARRAGMWRCGGFWAAMRRCGVIAAPEVHRKASNSMAFASACCTSAGCAYFI